MSWGITPRAMIGHSVGEFVAAVIAGVLSLEDALGVVAARGRLMQELPGGAMLAVRLPEADVLALLPPTLAIAAINGPALCVVSGPYEAVEAFEALLLSRNVVSRRLHTSHAFHSSMVDQMIEPLRAHLRPLRLSSPSIPYVSCVSGDWIRDDEATSPDYWARHAREPVRFSDGILKLAEISAMLLEVGPGAALSTLAAQSTRGTGVAVVTSMQDAARERSDRETILDAAGRLWINGAVLNWTAMHGVPRTRVPLPSYPFERKRHWIDAPVRTTAAASPPILIQDNSTMEQPPVDNRISDVSAAIAAIFEELSGETPAAADAQTTFLEMGYDSLFLTQVAQKIQSQMKVKITFRQLLGDFSTIPSLAKFLVDQMPAAPAAARPVAALAATAPVAAGTAAAAHRPAAPSVAVAVPSGAYAAGVEGIFRDQLEAMSQLINRQFEMLQNLGAGGARPAAPAATAPPQRQPYPRQPHRRRPTARRSRRASRYLHRFKKAARLGPPPNNRSISTTSSPATPKRPAAHSVSPKPIALR
jgi:malonyl CoA-acyl carrier protein transacylase